MVFNEVLIAVVVVDGIHLTPIMVVVDKTAPTFMNVVLMEVDIVTTIVNKKIIMDINAVMIPMVIGKMVYIILVAVTPVLNVIFSVQLMILIVNILVLILKNMMISLLKPVVMDALNLLTL